MEPVLSQQVGLDVDRAGSQQTGLLQKKQGPTEGKEEERRRTKTALEKVQAVESVLWCTCQMKVNI